MPWNEERTSVGNDWGKGPTIVNGIPATLKFPHSSKLALQPLTGTGSPQGEAVPVKTEDGSASFAIGPEYRTLWYELSVPSK